MDLRLRLDAREYLGGSCNNPGERSEKSLAMEWDELVKTILGVVSGHLISL